jgi:hypothetical protein
MRRLSQHDFTSPPNVPGRIPNGDHRIMHRITLPLTAGAVLLGSGLMFLSTALAQDVRGQLKIGVHKVKLDAGKMYQLEVSSGKAQVFVAVDFVDGQITRLFTKDFKEKLYFLPKESKDHTFFVTPGFGQLPKEGTIDYELKFKAMTFEDKAVLEAKSKLTTDDAKYAPPAGTFGGPMNMPFKDYKVQLKANQMYVIDMMRAKADIDPYLFLEVDGKVARQDDDSGGERNARIIFVPEKDAEYRVIATTLIQAYGDFTLMVRAVKE